MYLTAQHVVSEKDTSEGVNVFLYLHGPAEWSDSVQGVPDHHPGTLEAESICVRPGGNRVRSYLDIAAPDESSWTQIRHAFGEFLSRADSSALPWQARIDNCYFHLGMESRLAQHWERELAALYRAAQALWMAHVGARRSESAGGVA